MYEEYLGEGYHDKVRKMLTVDEKVLPNSVIDADLNIGGMKQLLSPALNKMKIHGKEINTEEKYNQLANAGIYYLCGILCMAMKSRTSAPPFNLKKYQKNWDKKQKNYMARGNKIMQGLMIGGN
ncbi:hypothetical protein ACR77J_11960 [Tissierella praeacuta]|uniref:hypothetical protein n=1 Tax=Tissierella praeacuta TaxID=43131 RepID=UPI003DA677B5